MFSILGIERAKEMMNNLYQSVIEQIKSLYGFDSCRTIKYVYQIQKRVVSRRYTIGIK